MAVLFLRNLHDIFRNDCSTLPSYQQCSSIPVSPHLCQYLLTVFFFFLFCFVFFFFFSFHSKMWGVISLCTVSCGLVTLSIFSYTVWPCMCLCWRNVYSSTLLIFILGIAVCYCVVGLPYALENDPLPYLWFAKILYVAFSLC